MFRQIHNPLPQPLRMAAWAAVCALPVALTGGCDAAKPVPAPEPHATSSEGVVATSPARKPASPEPEPDIDATLYDVARYATGAIPSAEHRALVEYGKTLAEQTWKYIGPDVADERMRFAGNRLACKNCHLDAGLRPLAAPWVGVAKRYPNFRARSGREGSLADRINGCMERSMDGKPLPEDGREMRAFMAWMEFLSAHAPDDGNVAGSGLARFAYPDRAVDLDKGKQVFQTRCTSCHGTEGLGVPNPAGGYVFPPLAGDDSYNTGAGMHRVLTAAAFIKHNMPLGATYAAPQLSDEEAFDVAGYIDSLPRPQKAGVEADFPDRKLKPMSTPYGPWADDITAEQHKYGPFGPIHDHYVQTHGLDKKK